MSSHAEGSALHEGSTVVHGNHHTLVIGDVGQFQLGTHRQSTMGRGQSITIELLAAGGAAAVEASGIVRANAGFPGTRRGRWLLGLRQAGGQSKDRQQKSHPDIHGYSHCGCDW